MDMRKLMEASRVGVQLADDDDDDVVFSPPDSFPGAFKYSGAMK